MNPFELFQVRIAPTLIHQSGEALSVAALRGLYIRMQAACHPDGFTLASTAEQQAASKMSASLADAYKVLSQDLSRVKLWLELKGIDLQTQTTQPDLDTFQLQMDLNDALDVLSPEDDAGQKLLRQRFDVLQKETMAWFQVQSDTEVFDLDRCLHYYGRLAMVSRLSQKLKDLNL